LPILLMQGDLDLQVTMEDMVYHTQAVKRGAAGKFIIADLPYMSYHVSVADTKQNAAILIIKGGANAVKLEGGNTARLEAIRAILDCEIPVCGHIGLTPQSVNKMGGYKIQGKTQSEYDRLFEEALQIEKAGAFMLVLEGIPEALGKAISEAVKIPTIGIGAGRYCDGQVLVFHDMLGWSGMLPKFVKQYADMNRFVAQMVNSYARDVRESMFPSQEQVYYPID